MHAGFPLPESVPLDSILTILLDDVVHLVFPTGMSSLLLPGADRGKKTGGGFNQALVDSYPSPRWAPFDYMACFQVTLEV